MNRLQRLKIIACNIIICCSAINAYSQTDKKNLVGMHFSSGSADHFAKIRSDEYFTEATYSIGFDYSRLLSKHLDFCTGFEYTFKDIRLATMPVQIKYRFGKLLYVNGGILINILFTTPKHSVHYMNSLLGCEVGIGIEHEFATGIIFSVHPFFRLNGIEIGENKGGQFTQLGVSLGIGYKF